MLHVLWLILKIIGILLLSLLGLFLVLIVLILFVPIRYQAAASYYGKLTGMAKITWLLHIVSFQCRYEDQFQSVIRVFGIRLFQEKKEKGRHRSANKKRKSGDNKRKKGSFIKQNKKPIKEQSPIPEPIETPSLEIQTEPEIKNIHSDAKPESETLKKQKSKRFDLRSKIQKIIRNTKAAFRRFFDKIKHTEERMSLFITWWENEKNRAALKLALRQIKALFRHILPGKRQGKIYLGFDDPYLTGQVLSYISLLNPVLGKQIEIYPVFERVVQEGELQIRGRIQLAAVIFILLRLWMDKSFRAFVRNFKN